MNLMRWRDERWEMNWARQGKAGETSQKGKRKKKGNKRTTVLVTYTLSRALKVLFFGSSPCIFFLGLDDHDPSSSSFPAKITPSPKGKRQKTKKKKNSTGKR